MKTPMTRAEEMRAFDAKSASMVRAEAKADRMVAGFSHTEATCEVHGVIDEPDEGTHCPICHEPCDMQPVMRGETKRQALASLGIHKAKDGTYE